MGDDLLKPQAPLLVPWTRQAERLVPGGKLHRAGAGVFREHHRQHFQENPVDIVLRLLLGEAETVHLNAVTEPAIFRIRNAVALAGDLVPQLDEGAHLAHLGDEFEPGIDEEADPADDLRKIFCADLTGVAHGVQHGDRRRQREGKLLHRSRACFLQVIGADIHRIPFRNLAIGVGRDIGDEPQARAGRKDIGPPAQIFLHDVVLHRTGKRRGRDALFLGERDIKCEQPGGGRIDRHGRVHAIQGNAVEQRPHIAEMADRHADLADLAARQLVVAVIAGLGRKIEGDREAGLAFFQIHPVERVGRGGGGVARIGADQPRAIPLAPGFRSRLVAAVLHLRNRSRAADDAPHKKSKPTIFYRTPNLPKYRGLFSLPQARPFESGPAITLSCKMVQRKNTCYEDRN